MNRVLSDPKLLPSHSAGLYKYKHAQPQPDANYLLKTRPKNISIDKERLYEENILYKHMLNNLTEENMKLKTRLSQIEKENQERMLFNSISVVKSKPQTHLIENLKSTVKELKSDLKMQTVNFEELKRSVRVTKMNEVSEVLKQYENECMRLKRLLEDILQDKNNPTSTLSIIEKLKNEKDQLERSLRFYQESDNMKAEQIEELRKIIRKNEHAEPIIDEEPISKESYGSKGKFDFEIKETPEYSFSDSRSRDLSNLAQPNEIKIDKEGHATGIQAKLVLKKIQIFLKVNKLTPNAWVQTISRSVHGIISFEELKRALNSASIPVNKEELDVLMRQFGENDNQILCSVIIEELNSMIPQNQRSYSTSSHEKSNSEVEQYDFISKKDAQTILEEIACRLTCEDIKYPKQTLLGFLSLNSYCFSDLYEEFSENYLLIEKQHERKEIVKYFLKNQKTISKESLVNALIEELGE